MVARYAWANTISLTKDSDSEIETFRYIISDPSSYLYLSPERPNPSCIPLYDTGYSTNTESIYCSDFSASVNTGEYVCVNRAVHRNLIGLLLASSET